MAHILRLKISRGEARVRVSPQMEDGEQVNYLGGGDEDAELMRMALPSANSGASHTNFFGAPSHAAPRVPLTPTVIRSTLRQFVEDDGGIHGGVFPSHGGPMSSFWSSSCLEPLLEDCGVCSPIPTLQSNSIEQPDQTLIDQHDSLNQAFTDFLEDDGGDDDEDYNGIQLHKLPSLAERGAVDKDDKAISDDMFRDGDLGKSSHNFDEGSSFTEHANDGAFRATSSSFSSSFSLSSPSCTAFLSTASSSCGMSSEEGDLNKSSALEQRRSLEHNSHGGGGDGDEHRAHSDAVAPLCVDAAASAAAAAAALTTTTPPPLLLCRFDDFTIPAECADATDLLALADMVLGDGDDDDDDAAAVAPPISSGANRTTSFLQQTECAKSHGLVSNKNDQDRARTSPLHASPPIIFLSSNTTPSSVLLGSLTPLVSSRGAPSRDLSSAGNALPKLSAGSSSSVGEGSDSVGQTLPALQTRGGAWLTTRAATEAAFDMRPEVNDEEDERGDEDTLDQSRARRNGVVDTRQQKQQQQQQFQAEKQQRRGLSKGGSCRCKKTHCLKLYCECFSAGATCEADTCGCVDCHNQPSDRGTGRRQLAVAKCLVSKSRSFRPKTQILAREGLNGSCVTRLGTVRRDALPPALGQPLLASLNSSTNNNNGNQPNSTSSASSLHSSSSFFCNMRPGSLGHPAGCFTSLEGGGGDQPGGDRNEEVGVNRSSSPALVASPLLTVPTPTQVVLPPPRCFCKKSKCIKKYCDCFAGGFKCAPGRCKCRDCANLDPEHTQGMAHAAALAAVKGEYSAPLSSAGGLGSGGGVGGERSPNKRACPPPSVLLSNSGSDQPLLKKIGGGTGRSIRLSPAPTTVAQTTVPRRSRYLERYGGSTG